ncbi:MAG TPA: TrkH family potassium uptake protein [Vicinamibacterales bacterium]|nr:TrkH family potassium uptake protein [Vicinamibacterales bacterium]
MRVSLVAHVTGIVVRVFGLMFLAPLAVALFYREISDAAAFATACIVTTLAGHAMRHAGGKAAEEAVESMRRVEGLAVVSAAWLLIALFAGIPYLWNGLSFIDATFEAMSGLTTTGATVFRDFSLYGRSVFFWRSLTNWLGGMGVIALFVAVLPRLAIGGREIFFAEASGPDDEKVAPQIRRTAALLWRLYAALTVLQIIALVMTGMPLFDSVCNTFGTIAAAGFSPHPLSISGYQNPAAEWVIIVFMFLAGANFALQYRALMRRDWRTFANDDELRAYVGVVVLATIALAMAIRQTDDSGILRTALFQVLSILTTTGFASVDFNLWNDQAKAVLLGLMFIGGCAGSAGGGPKVVRHVLLARFTLQELRRTLHPRAILPVKLGGRVVPAHIMQGVIVFFLFYMLTFAVCSAIVILLGADLVTGISATAATLGNVGPGFNQVGPMAHFADLHPISRIVLTFAMWVGRLEVITVLVILRPEAWRAGRWSSAGAGDSPSLQR